MARKSKKKVLKTETWKGSELERTKLLETEKTKKSGLKKKQLKTETQEGSELEKTKLLQTEKRKKVVNLIKKKTTTNWQAKPN